MKRMIAGLFAVLLFASHLSAQGAIRHRDSPAPSSIGLRTLLDSRDPLSASHLRPESDRTPKSPSANPVPASQLRIPSKALKEFALARKAFQSGDIDNSAEHLQKAVRIYPDFLEAHNALGLRFVQIGEYQKAIAEQEIALSIDPRSAQTHQNLSLALLLLNRYQEAEAQARQALDLDPQPTASRYFLARALVGQRRITPEAIQMLQQSEAAFPNASLVLAQIDFTKGRTEQVIADLRHYLQAPSDPENKQKAECWVAQLNQQPAPTGCPTEVTRPSFR